MSRITHTMNEHQRLQHSGSPRIPAEFRALLESRLVWHTYEERTEYVISYRSSTSSSMVTWFHRPRGWRVDPYSVGGCSSRIHIQYAFRSPRSVVFSTNLYFLHRCYTELSKRGGRKLCMLHLGPNLEVQERVVLNVDTTQEATAEELVTIARDAGSRIIKLGLEYQNAHENESCSELAGDFGMDWIADFKYYGISSTVCSAVDSLTRLAHPPVGITIATRSGVNALRNAQKIAKDSGIMIFGAAHLSSIDERETRKYEKTVSRVVMWRESRRAVAGRIGGMVCSGQEVAMLKKYQKTNGLYLMVPGSRSLGAEKHEQKRTLTPGKAFEAGADLILVGRQVAEAENRKMAYELVRDEVVEADQKLRSESRLS